MSLFKVSVPGKVILHGEHAVVFGKAAVAASLDLRTEVIVFSEERQVILETPQLNLHQSWNVEEFFIFKSLNLGSDKTAIVSDDVLEKITSHFSIERNASNINHQTLLSFLFLYIGISLKSSSGDFQPLRIVVSSRLPMGTGLGSSASYSVGVASVLLAATNSFGNAFQLSSLELSLINEWAFQSERVLHGRPSGVDNTICTFGGAVLYKNGKISEVLERTPKYRVLLVNTKVPRSTLSLVAGVKQRHDKYPGVIAPVLESIEAISEESWNLLKNVSAPVKSQFFEAESDLISINHCLLNSIGVGHPQLEVVQQIALKYEFPCKLTGAGGGGCAFILLALGEGFEEGSSPVRFLKEELLGQNFECYEVELGCSGVTFHMP